MNESSRSAREPEENRKEKTRGKFLVSCCFCACERDAITPRVRAAGKRRRAAPKEASGLACGTSAGETGRQLGTPTDRRRRERSRTCASLRAFACNVEESPFGYMSEYPSCCSTTPRVSSGPRAGEGRQIETHVLDKVAAFSIWRARLVQS